MFSAKDCEKPQKRCNLVKNCMTLHWSVVITTCILTAHLNHLLIYIHTFSLLHLIGTLCNILLKCTLDIQPGVQFHYTLFHMVASCFDTSSQKIKSKQINTSCNQSHQGKRQEYNTKIIKDLSHIGKEVCMPSPKCTASSLPSHM